ncbi:biotin--[acetyl-CoA-carboxylase] ligase [Nitrosomonas sp.]|uniref:biotin--[acetyl-CoA-carboxylase] ligase n=1 Tax=Nitrosomonas sp. TaxID=42353 RepID=UPI0026214317|nr:biotin--[acetyl-CoA-carboxylase] ligase [Nitrosomonas sp.]
MNIYTISILRLLSDGKFHSSVSIVEHFQCSRKTISRALKCINALGICLTKLRGKGYRWERPIRWLNSDVILRNLASNINSRLFDLIILDSIDSTNNFLLKNLEIQQERNTHILVVAAELQTAGRGRLGRTWYSGLGDSLTFSLRWHFNYSIYELSGLSLVIGIAIIRVLNSFSIKDVSLKWPNDILFHRYKLAGILIELRGEVLGSSCAVIGVGINFNLSEKIKSAIEQKATDLFTITGDYIDRNVILGALLSELRDILIAFEKYGFVHFKKEWISYHAFEGEKVYLTLPNGSVIEGIADGINDDGALFLVTAAGRNSYNVGDVSLRMK